MVCTCIPVKSERNKCGHLCVSPGSSVFLLLSPEQALIGYSVAPVPQYSSVRAIAAALHAGCGLERGAYLFAELGYVLVNGLDSGRDVVRGQCIEQRFMVAAHLFQ